MPDKEKLELEFLLKTSPRILYNMISTPSGLAEWFADDVNVRDDRFTFFWNGSEETALLLTKSKDQFVRFRWENDEDEEEVYFEFRIKIDALTREVALIITDFADEDEVEESTNLWESQVEDLKRVLGA